MSLPITTSPDITLLDFNVLYDISGGIPLITLTNQSVGNPSGDTNLDNCNWWYTITMPDGTYVHQGSEDNPDVTSNDWATLAIPSGSWPTPFGVPPYGQIEFSCSVPYRTTLYVQDGDGNIFSLTKQTTICRPAGNTDRSLGNFGAANVAVTVKCDIAKIYANDTTNYTYQSRFGTFDANTWKLAYPMDAEGNIPAPFIVEDQGRIIAPVGYSALGYQLNLGTYATYDMGDGQYIKIQYKFNRVFPVYCNVDLCQLTCEIDKLYKLLPSKCGTVENPEVKDKLLRINTLMGQVFIGINQPLCGVDVPALIEQIKKIGGFTCNCGVAGGINAIGSTDGSINIELDLEGGIEGSVTNTGDNYVIHLEVPGATAGTLQVVTDNGNITTNDMTSGNAAAGHTTMTPSFYGVWNNTEPYALLGKIDPSETCGTLYLKRATTGGVYLRPHPTSNTYQLWYPQAQGTSGQTLINDGAGQLSWGALSSGTLQTVTDAGSTTTNSIKVAGIGMNSVAKSADYTALDTDYEILCDVTAASLVITLPNTIGKIFCVKLVAPIVSGRTVTVVAASGLIDSAANYVLRIENQSAIFKCGFSGLYSVEADSQPGVVKLSGAISGATTIIGANTITPYTVRMPPAQGSANTYLRNNGSGDLAWNVAPVPTLQDVVTQGNTSTNPILITGLGMSSRTISASTTVLVGDYEILCNLSVGSITLTLDGALVGSVFCIKLLGPVASGRTVTLIVSGSGTIDGASSYILKYNNSALIVKCSSTGVYSIESEYINNGADIPPTVTVGAGAGAGATVSASNSTDRKGALLLTTGTTPVLGNLLTISYGIAGNASNPIPVISGGTYEASVAIGAGQISIGSVGNLNFQLVTPAGAAPLTASTVYLIYYNVIR